MKIEKVKKVNPYKVFVKGNNLPYQNMYGYITMTSNKGKYKYYFEADIGYTNWLKEEEFQHVEDGKIIRNNPKFKEKKNKFRRWDKRNSKKTPRTEGTEEKPKE